MVKKQKAKAIAIKWCRARRGISLSIEKEDDNDTGDNIDLNQANNKYIMSL